MCRLNQLLLAHPLSQYMHAVDLSLTHESGVVEYPHAAKQKKNYSAAQTSTSMALCQHKYYIVYDSGHWIVLSSHLS